MKAGVIESGSGRERQPEGTEAEARGGGPAVNDLLVRRFMARVAAPSYPELMKCLNCNAERKNLMQRNERSGQRPRGSRSAMGEFTVVQKGQDWIVLEDGRRVGGTLRYPFPCREEAQRYVDRELADEAEIMAKGDFALSAKTRAIRETDAELWAQFANIEEEFADEDEATKEAAHRAAGTFIVIIRLVMAGLEAACKIYRTGKMRNGRPVFAVRSNCH